MQTAIEEKQRQGSGEKPVKMGTLGKSWERGRTKSVTFCVTEDCNLRCKYCYMTGKNHRNKMTFEVAKTAVDYILSHRDIFNEDSVIWEFIGGEPLLEIELIDRICDYIKQRTYMLDHPWFDSYMFSMSSNGILYGENKVQEFIRKNQGHIYIGISVDGNKLKHDLQRVKPDGSGSFDDVTRNVPLWLEQFPGSHTKATFSSDDLPYLKDSIIAIWNMGIDTAAANIVFEDVWKEGDDAIFETQLKELADYILEKELWNDYSVRFFDPHLGFPETEHAKDRPYCGSGRMLAVNYKGDLYSCVRFVDYCLEGRERCIGNIYDGIDQDRVRPFLVSSLRYQSGDKCLECRTATGCATCVGNNFNCSDCGTIFNRTTYQCEMQKANVRACRYFWEKYSEKTGLKSEREKHKEQLFRDKDWRTYKARYLYFITSDSAPGYCGYKGSSGTGAVMDKEVLKKGLEFVAENDLIPVFLGDTGMSGEYLKTHMGFVMDAGFDSKDAANIVVYCDFNPTASEVCPETAIVKVTRDSLPELYSFIESIYRLHGRINLVIEDMEGWKDTNVREYEKQLGLISELMTRAYGEGMHLQVNNLTDIMSEDGIAGCGAGENSICLAPNGRFYTCPAFYFDDPKSSIGVLGESGAGDLYRTYRYPICSKCDITHCRKCKFVSKKLTGEPAVPSRIQCMAGMAERRAAKALQDRLVEKGMRSAGRTLEDAGYEDPLENACAR